MSRGGPGSSAPAAWDDMVLVGRVARTHGLRGHVVVTPDTDFVEERFAPGSALWVRAAGADPTRVVVASSRVQGGRPVVGFDGVDDIDAAEDLLGLELRVPPDSLQPLPEGTVYHHQLLGCVVETTEGLAVGEVVRIEGGAAGSLLVVAGKNGEVLIPFASAICVGVDVAQRRIRVALPEGLLELNAVTGSSGRRRGRRRGSPE